MTESAPTSIEQCLSILLHAILDHIGLWDLLRAMRVNRLWREHAINHPTYYRDLCLTKKDNPDCFLLRLSRSAGRPISVDVHVGKQTPLTLMREIGNRLAHITSLTVTISSKRSVAAVLPYLFYPAPVLRNLKLYYGGVTSQPHPPTLPTDLFAHHAPALEDVAFAGFDLSAGIPEYFSTITALSFLGWGPDMLVLPNPFRQCPHLRELHLTNFVTLHPEACCVTNHDAWKRLTEVTFYGSYVACRWPDFELPLREVRRISVGHGNAESALALASTLPGPLHATFSPPRHYASLATPGREPFNSYKAVLRSMSLAGDHSRLLEGPINEQDCISAFSNPYLADRIVCLELALDAWNVFVGLSTFGPFNALDELVLTLQDGTEFQRNTASSKLSCPKLQRLVLRGTRPTVTADMAAVATFALGSLSEAQFPLRLEVIGIALAGEWNSIQETFSACVYR